MFLRFLFLNSLVPIDCSYSIGSSLTRNCLVNSPSSRSYLVTTWYHSLAWYFNLAIETKERFYGC